MRLVDQLPALESEYPSYAFTVARTSNGLSIVAARNDDTDGPLLIITSDVAELRRHLSGTSAPR